MAEVEIIKIGIEDESLALDTYRAFMLLGTQNVTLVYSYGRFNVQGILEGAPVYNSDVKFPEEVERDVEEGRETNSDRTDPWERSGEGSTDQGLVD